MPIYDYSCMICDDNKEIMTTIEKRDRQNCPKCGMPLERKLTFKGSVWSPTRNGGQS
jgi:putative FmdB family regulatory protein